MPGAQEPARPVARYLPIGDYGAIGDGRSVALVSREGSIDWWAPARFDAPSVFAAILDARRGGTWTLGPRGDARSTQRYVRDTNVLETEHATASGRVLVRDFLAEGAGVDDAVLVRRVRAVEGRVELTTTFAPRFAYGRNLPRFSRSPAGLLASGGGEIMLLDAPVDWRRSVAGARSATLDLAAGEEAAFVLRHAPFASPVPFASPLAASPASLEEAALDRWTRWAARTRFEGPDAPLVRRSALALKLLQARNGAFVAAATTSLPESIGGVRNWDYRFAWLRDGAVSARALHDLGHVEDAAAFTRWVLATLGDRAEDLRIMYTVSGATELPERELPQLEGYRRSAPVRVGNAAAHQRQLDTYGELVFYLHGTRAKGDAAAWPLVRSVADWVCAHWREPDHGIWEMRAAPRHFVLSKALACVGLERASDLASELGHPVPPAWTSEAAAIREQVLAEGYSAARRSFVQAYGSPALDASNLLLPLVGFIEPRDPRMLDTVDRTLEELTLDGLVFRYLAPDGLPGSEGTFAYCTFWLIEVLALQGRVREARALFDRIAARATPLGLYAEEIDAATGEQLGNFPQAFPHAGLIAAAQALALAERGG